MYIVFMYCDECLRVCPNRSANCFSPTGLLNYSMSNFQTVPTSLLQPSYKHIYKKKNNFFLPVSSSSSVTKSKPVSSQRVKTWQQWWGKKEMRWRPSQDDNIGCGNNIVIPPWFASFVESCNLQPVSPGQVRQTSTAAARVKTIRLNSRLRLLCRRHCHYWKVDSKNGYSHDDSLYEVHGYLYDNKPESRSTNNRYLSSLVSLSSTQWLESLLFLLICTHTHTQFLSSRPTIFIFPLSSSFLFFFLIHSLEIHFSFTPFPTFLF